MNCARDRKLFAFENFVPQTRSVQWQEKNMFSLVGQGLIAVSEFTNLFLGCDKLYFKVLKSERDFSILQKKFEQADGIRLPADYLKQGRAFICFNDHLEPQGGFALIDNGPFRTLEQIPEDILQPVETKMTEITAVCLSPGHPLRRTRYWSFVVGQALCGHSSHLVYAVDSDKTALRERVFNHIRAHTLYEGPVKKLDGMSAATIEAVELTTKSHLAKGFVKLALNEAGKLRTVLEGKRYKVAVANA
ncbi:MAG: hypothetical protein EBR09_01100 [Proteobacteria bacterium]|nr:hypothetical protein [Pseudomonadota bacterium]